MKFGFHIIWRWFMWSALVSFTLNCYARDYIIYSVMHELPMGVPGEVLTKNYYLNLGKNQGVMAGNRLEVFRVISRLDPYENKKRYNYRVKVGELKVIHAEDDAAIGVVAQLALDPSKTPVFELKDFMIGDRVDVMIK